MNARERGFLLLCSHLGDPQRKVLTTAQLRELARRVRLSERPGTLREMETDDLRKLGYSGEFAARILGLLEQEALLDHYLDRGAKLGCVPLTWASEGYPDRLRGTLKLERPGCLWAKGDLTILTLPAVALVGSRELREENRHFAEAVGREAARQGYVLVSGNARGADRTAQESCLENGGRVVCVVADELSKQPVRKNVLYLSEDGYQEAFSAQRALSRNRVIHALGTVTFVAQSASGRGGTWSGTVRNLRSGWSGVCCFRDGSEAMGELAAMGAVLIPEERLADFSALGQNPQLNMEI